MAWRWTWRVALLLLLAGYLRWLAPALTPYATGSDASGYLWSARLFRHGTLSVPIDVPRGFPVEAVAPDAFAPLGARVMPGTWNLVPTYPTGLPLHIAAATLFLSEESAVSAVLIIVAGAALGLLYLLAREAGLQRWWALAGSVVMACSPLFLFMAVQPMSDVAATAWAEAAILCAWRSRRRTTFAAAAGVSLGIATLVRPTNALLIVPMAAAIPLTIRHYAAFGAGGLPFGAFVLLYQARAYGHPFASGYLDLSAALSLTTLWPSVVHYVRWLPRVASWLIVCAPAALIGWIGPLKPWRVVVALWMLVLFGIYACYPVTSETWWSLRFVLPAFPPLVIASLVGLREISAAVARRTHLGAVSTVMPMIAVIAAVVALLGSEQFAAHRQWKDSERVYPDALKVLTLDRPQYAVTLALQMSGAANYYARDLHVLRYDALSTDGWTAIRAWQARERVTVGAVLFGDEVDRFAGPNRARFPCSWESRGHYRHVTFWECPP
jgi:hypothetical protein